MKIYKSYKGTTTRVMMGNEYSHYFPMALPGKLSTGQIVSALVVSLIGAIIMFLCVAGLFLAG